MPEPLKHMYDRAYVEKLSDQIYSIEPAFSRRTFIEKIFDRHWNRRELKNRMYHISSVLGLVLPGPYRRNLRVLMSVARRDRMGRSANFADMCFPGYVELYGLEDYEASIPALELFTQLSSSEFAVRPFIVKYGPVMMNQMAVWARDTNEHVRRLASEGCRPRLPWATALPEFKKNPEPVLQILETLKGDPSAYVRRSVANNLNDIAKDHPGIVLKTARRWIGVSEETDQLLRHACRTLLKKDLPQALSLFGYSQNGPVNVTRMNVTPRRTKIGGAVDVSCRLVCKGLKPMNLRLEYAVHYVKSGGRIHARIFQIGRKTMGPAERHAFRFRHTFRDLSTRSHHPGTHALAVLINGKEMRRVKIELFR